MKNLTYILAVAVAMIANSCTKEQTTNEGTTKIVIGAEVAADDSRSAYDEENNQWNWEATDKIHLAVGSMVAQLPFTQVAGALSADKRTTKFEGTLSEEVTGVRDVVAVSVDGRYISVVTALGTGEAVINFTSQSYTADGYHPYCMLGCYHGDVTDFSNVNLRFINPFATLKLRLTADKTLKVSQIVFSGNNNENVGGYATFTYNGSAVAFNSSRLTEKSITLNCGDAEISAEPKDFYFSIPPIAYSAGYSVTILTDEGKMLQTKSSAADYSTKQNAIISLPAFKVVPAADYVVVDYTAIPDANFRTSLQTAGLVDLDETNQKITIKDNGSTVTNLTIGNYVENLTGIDYFSELQSIAMNNNWRLTSLTLSLKKLTQISCYSCTQLTAIDLSGCDALTYVDCFDSSVISSIKLPTSITHLNCRNCQLSALDVTGYTQLASFFCHGNMLTTLDLSNNTKLRSISCYNNRLSTLDVSGLSYQYLYCGNQTTDGTTSQDITVYMTSKQKTYWDSALYNESNNGHVTTVVK